CNSSRPTWNSRMTWRTTAMISVGPIPSNMRSRQRPRRSSCKRDRSCSRRPEVGWEEGRPLTDAVDRLAGHEEIGEEDEQGGHGREFGTRVVPGEMLAEEASQLHPLDDSVEQGQGADVIGAE